MQEQFEAGVIIEAPVIDHNKGGLIVDCGIRGFVPISQIVDFPRRPQNEQPRDAAQEIAEKLQPYVGRKLRLKILEVNRKANRLILSEKVALYEERREKRDELFSSLQVGQKVNGNVRSIAPFGVFIDLGGIDGLVHKSELSWNKVNNPESGYKVGDEVEAEVIDINHERGRISLSIRRLQPDPWNSTVADFKVGDIIDGTVTKLVNFGAFVRVREGLEGLIHISELTHQRVAHPGDVVHEGQTLKLKIISLDSERHRLGLSLKQAEEPPAARAGARRRRRRPSAWRPRARVRARSATLSRTRPGARGRHRQHPRRRVRPGPGQLAAAEEHRRARDRREPGRGGGRRRGGPEAAEPAVESRSRRGRRRREAAEPRGRGRRRRGRRGRAGGRGRGRRRAEPEPPRPSPRPSRSRAEPRAEAAARPEPEPSQAEPASAEPSPRRRRGRRPSRSPRPSSPSGGPRPPRRGPRGRAEKAVAEPRRPRRGPAFRRTPDDPPAPAGRFDSFDPRPHPCDASRGDRLDLVDRDSRRACRRRRTADREHHCPGVRGC